MFTAGRHTARAHTNFYRDIVLHLFARLTSLEDFDLLHKLVRRHLAVHRLVHYDDRCDATGADAIHFLHGEPEVFGSLLARGDGQLLGQAVDEPLGALDVARGAPAGGNDVLPPGLQVELGVEGGHPVEPRRRDIEPLREPGYRVLPQVPELALDILKDRDQVPFIFPESVIYS